MAGGRGAYGKGVPVASGMFHASERRPWMGVLIRGWRLEIALALGSLLVFGISSRLGTAGPVLATVLVIAVLHFRPNLRVKLETALGEHRERRSLEAALWHCAVVGRRGDIPRVVRSASLPVGRRFLVSLPVGLHFEAMKKSEAELAAALSVRQVRVAPFVANARYVEIAVIRANAFPRSIASPLLARWRVSLWEPVPFGVGQDGLAVSLHLPEHNLLIGGEPGSGKSVALSTIVGAAALDPTVHLTLLDGKDVELVSWSGIADQFIGADREGAVEVLEELVDLMDERYQRLVAARKRKVVPGDLDGLHVVVIDEVAFYLRGGRRQLESISRSYCGIWFREVGLLASSWWRPPRSRVMTLCPRSSGTSSRIGWPFAAQVPKPRTPSLVKVGPTRVTRRQPSTPRPEASDISLLKAARRFYS